MSDPPSAERFSHEAMATAFDIMIAGHPAVYARQAAAAAFRELDRLETELSRFVESSDIARANRLKEGECMTIGDDALRCLVIAAEISASTGRAFDPAYASEAASADFLNQVLFALDPGAHTLTSLTPRLHLDLGAVGKGFALDVMAALLEEWDIKSACIQSGGSTALALDPPPGAAGWPLGLGDETPAACLFTLSQRALSGSGLAVKGPHLIDPRTARPAHRTRRVWAFAPTAAVADALSTAFFVMSNAAVEQYCQAHPEFGAALTMEDGRIVLLGTAEPLCNGP